MKATTIKQAPSISTCLLIRRHHHHHPTLTTLTIPSRIRSKVSRDEVRAAARAVRATNKRQNRTSTQRLRKSSDRSSISMNLSENISTSTKDNLPRNRSNTGKIPVTERTATITAVLAKGVAPRVPKAGPAKHVIQESKKEARAVITDIEAK